MVRGPDGLLTWLGSNLKTLLSNWLYYLCIHSLYNQWKFLLKIYSNTQYLNSRKWQKGLDRLHFIFMCTQRYRSTDHNIDFLHTQKWKLQLYSHSLVGINLFSLFFCDQSYTTQETFQVYCVQMRDWSTSELCCALSRERERLGTYKFQNMKEQTV